MNNNIIIPNASFDFSKLSLAAPIAIQGGAYCTKLLYEDGPIYIQAPKGTTRQGFMKTGKKMFRLGGFLSKVNLSQGYVVLNNGNLSWSVQLKGSIFLKK